MDKETLRKEGDKLLDEHFAKEMKRIADEYLNPMFEQRAKTSITKRDTK